MMETTSGMMNSLAERMANNTAMMVRISNKMPRTSTWGRAAGAGCGCGISALAWDSRGWFASPAAVMDAPDYLLLQNIELIIILHAGGQANEWTPDSGVGPATLVSTR